MYWHVIGMTGFIYIQHQKNQQIWLAKTLKNIERDITKICSDERRIIQLQTSAPHVPPSWGYM